MTPVALTVSLSRIVVTPSGIDMEAIAP